MHLKALFVKIFDKGCLLFLNYIENKEGRACRTNRREGPCLHAKSNPGKRDKYLHEIRFKNEETNSNVLISRDNVS